MRNPTTGSRCRPVSLQCPCACVRASRVVQYTRTETVVNKNREKIVKSDPVFDISSWIWYTHHPSLIPLSTKPKWRHSICIMSRGCQGVGFLYPSHWIAERSVWCANWLVLELFQFTDFTCGVPTDWSLNCSSAHTLCVVCQMTGSWTVPGHRLYVWCANWLVLELFQFTDFTGARLRIGGTAEHYREAVATYFKILLNFPAGKQERSVHFRCRRFELQHPVRWGNTARYLLYSRGKCMNNTECPKTPDSSRIQKSANLYSTKSYYLSA
jgi:hypothetical protein